MRRASRALLPAAKNSAHRMALEDSVQIIGGDRQTVGEVFAADQRVGANQLGWPGARKRFSSSLCRALVLLIEDGDRQPQVAKGKNQAWNWRPAPAGRPRARREFVCAYAARLSGAAPWRWSS